jgi:hypothetical protein
MTILIEPSEPCVRFGVSEADGAMLRWCDVDADRDVGEATKG